MTLTPRQPPGRSSRKARAFVDEIQRLRAEGYTCVAIRDALADAGLQVSKSTVQREASRPAQRRLFSQSAPQVLALPPADVVASGAMDSGAAFALTAPTAPCAPPIQATRPVVALPRRSGREIAEAFACSHIDNPLIRKDLK